MAKRKFSKKFLAMIVSLFCVAISVGAVITVFLQTQSKYVTADIMDNYAKTLISEYNRSIDFFLQSTRQYFHFYSENSYSCISIISSTHGAAILLNPEKNWTFTNVDTNRRIEEAVFGGNLTTVFWQISNGSYNCLSVGQTFINWGRPPYEVVGTGQVLIENITFESVPCFFIAMKGSNETAYWTTEWAKNDSRYLFESNLYHALENSEEVRKRYAEPELTALLQDVLNKMGNQSKVPYSYLQQLEDLNNIEQIAKTKYGITNSSDLINGMFDRLKVLTTLSPPTKTLFTFEVNDPDNWLYVTVCGIYPVCLFACHFIFQNLLKKYPSKNLKVWLVEFVLMGTLIPSGINYLFFTRPYDYQWNSIQTVVIFVIWIIGFFAVNKGRKVLGIWLARK